MKQCLQWCSRYRADGTNALDIQNHFKIMQFTPVCTKNSLFWDVCCFCTLCYTTKLCSHLSSNISLLRWFLWLCHWMLLRWYLMLILLVWIFSCWTCTVAVRVIRDKPGYFALKMQKAMKGLGTDDQALVRIIISRSECDMVQIKNSFEQQFQGQLADWIRVCYHKVHPSIVLTLWWYF